MYNHELLTATTEDQLKKMYFQFAKILHPDHGGKKSDFQALQADYEKMFNKLAGLHSRKDGGMYHQATTERAPEYIHIIDKLMTCAGLTIEFIGSFIWITGNTKANRSTLKALGFKYSSNKKAWYKAPQGYEKHNNKVYSMDDIRNKFGVSNTIKTPERRRLAW